MHVQQNCLYWGITYILIFSKNFDVISVSKDNTDIWLTNKKEVIRLKKETLNFDINLKNDLLDSLRTYEQFKIKRMIRSEKLTNVYITADSLTYDYSSTIEKSITKQLGKIEVKVIDSFSLESDIKEHLLSLGFTIEDYNLFKSISSKGESYIIHNISSYLTNKREKAKKLLDYGNVFFTYLFLVIQIIMFLILELNGGSQNINTLIRFGAKYNPYILEGQLWRFITPIFLHIGFFHLIMNSLALYYIGTQLEKIFGSIRFLFIYLISGAIGVLFSFLFNNSVAAGASGAIFGCLGAMFYASIIYKDILSRELQTSIISIISINLIFGAIMPAIDNSGHIGGLIGGLLITLIIGVPKHK